jgi:Anaphase-promoting complex subunit 11 RING-H2 finger
MKVIVKQWHAIAQWQWDTGKADENGDPEEDVCGICRVPFEGCCPTCKVPGDDCPLSRYLVPAVFQRWLTTLQLHKYGGSVAMYSICTVF